jgi:hypothetical protein
MNWRNFIIENKSSNFSDEELLTVVNRDCPDVTLDMLQTERYALSE